VREVEFEHGLVDRRSVILPAGTSISTLFRGSPTSPDDAKPRAEADLRRGDPFEDIQDSWPKEIVSVEALAVEPYPELE